MLKENCSHCDPRSFALKYPLEVTNNFWVVCDVHPIIEGHILIIPKKHIVCVGAYPKELFQEFIVLYYKISQFIQKTYGKVSSFEHGKIGQTVFHSHVHLLPYKGNPTTIIPEGETKFFKIDDLSQLINIFNKDSQYLFFSIGGNKWVVDTAIGAPRFFRDRFSNALNRPERGNWKNMKNDKQIMTKSNLEIAKLIEQWKIYFQH